LMASWGIACRTAHRQIYRYPNKKSSRKKRRSWDLRTNIIKWISKPLRGIGETKMYSLQTLKVEKELLEKIDLKLERSERD
jgi:cytochrome c2